MGKKASIYTRGGDKGETSLLSGSRLPKNDIRIELYGNFDELNSHIGYFSSLLAKEVTMPKVEGIIFSIQNILFDIGAMLACESSDWERFKLKKIPSDIIGQMEILMDEMDSELPPLKAFILPNGTNAAAYSHVCRTFCRKVERCLVGYLQAGHIIPENSIEFTNRLSDFLFQTGRYVNFKQGKTEVEWSSK